MAVSLLDRAIYSYRDVDRLVGLPVGTSRRWLNGYHRGGVFYEPVLRAEARSDDSVSWGEMVETRLLAEFRERRVPVQAMRPAVERLRGEFGAYPLARARPLLDVDGRELVMRVQDEVALARGLQLVVVRNGQLQLSAPSRRFSESIEYSDERAVAITPERRTPNVIMRPEIAFGQPAVSGRAVRTATLAEDYRAGASVEELADLYELSVHQVDQAVRFELIAASTQAA